MTRKPRPLYALEGRSWTGCKVVLLYFRTRLELTEPFCGELLMGLGEQG